MGLAQHFSKHHTVEDDVSLEDVDQVGLAEAALEAYNAETDFDTQMDSFKTQLLLESLSTESGELSEEALNWKQFAETRLTDSLEADDKGKSLWRRMVDAIKAFFKKIRDAFKSFWKKSEEAGNAYKAKAEALKKKAKDLKDPKNREFESDLYGLLGKGKKGTSGKEITDDMKYLADVMNDIFSKDKDMVKIAKDYQSTIIYVSKALPVIKDNPLTKDVTALSKAFTFKTMQKKDKVFDVSLKSVDVHSSEELPGGVYVGHTSLNPASLRAYLATASSISTMKEGKVDDIAGSFRPLAKRGDGNEEKGSVPTLRSSEIISVCDSIIKITEDAERFNGNLPERERVLSGIEKATDVLNKELESKGDKLSPAQKAVVTDTITFSRAILGSMNQMPLFADKVALTIIKNALRYCDESVNQH